MLETARNRGARDVHIIPGGELVHLKFRLKDRLFEAASPGRSIYPALAAGLKTLAGLSLDETLTPQEGSFTLEDDAGRPLDASLATLPTIHGEKLLLQLRARREDVPLLGELGLQSDDLAKLHRALSAGQGMVLTSGPQESGKEALLYSLLGELAHLERQIVTLESPVAYPLPNAVQTQVNPQRGLTYPVGMRAVLRQDPDTILLTEIADRETASLAVESSLSGRLVLSSIHAREAVGAPAALRHLGVEPYLAGAALTVSIAQRAAPRLCSRCKEPYTPDPKRLQALGLSKFVGERFYRPKTCKHCENGKDGRLLLVEVLEMDDNLRELALHATPVALKREAVRRRKLRTLRMQALNHLLKGDLALEDYVRVAAS